MSSILKDVPFIDILGPVLLALTLWLGTNILVIAPQIVAPRMTDNVWMPACKGGVDSSNNVASAKRQSDIAAYIAARKGDKNELSNVMTPFLQAMGEDMALTLGKHMMGNMNRIADAEIAAEVRNKFRSNPVAHISAANYCGCIISELRQDRIATGLYSASLRLWEPANIQQLNQLGQTLVTSAQCNPKELTQ
ncbi:MAG: hypothetical protein ABJP08_29060 [Roseibium sp.]